MAFSRQDIRIAGARALQDRLKDIRALPKTIANDPRIPEAIIERQKRRFVTKKGPDGRRWRQLSSEFFKRKFNPTKSDILVDSGALRDSIGVTGRRGRVTGLGFRIGITQSRLVGRGELHQTGGRSPLTGGPIPARPFLGIAKEDVTIVERLLLRIAKEKGL